MSLEKKVSIITGAGKGIGKKIALTLAEKGATIVVVDIDENNAKKTVEEIIEMGSEAMYIKTDVSNVDQLKEMVETVVNKYGVVDVLVNNAGILQTTAIDDYTEAEWDRIMNINVKSAFFASQQVLKYMKKQKSGKIINISSNSGRMGGYSTACGYATSKAAIIGMTMNIARRVAEFNINVNAVAPGTIETEIGFDQDQFNKLKATIPMGRLGKPKNIADAVAFLAGDEAEFITGAVIDVNGGAFMG